MDCFDQVKKEEIPTLALHSRDGRLGKAEEEKRLGFAPNLCQQSPDGSPSYLAAQESHETEESSSLSRSNLVKLSRQRYSPAPLGTNFSVLHGNGKGSPYSPRTVGSLCPTNSPRCPL